MSNIQLQQNPLVSIIVPIYNVKSFLEDSVSSIIRQTYTNLDIVLIDDGSTDGSGLIADRLSANDCRIRVFHQPNRGLSAARNAGILKAKGRLLTFLDSDDAYGPQCIEHLCYAMKFTGSDISICNIRTFTGEGHVPNYCLQVNNDSEYQSHISTFEPLDAITDVLYMRTLPIGASGKLYRRSLFDTIRYPVGKLYEDIGTTVRLFDKAHGICFIDYRDFLYRFREGSIQHSTFSIQQMDLIYNIQSFRKLLELKYPSALPAFRSKLLSAAFNIMMKIPTHDKRYQSESLYLWKLILANRKSVLLDCNARTLARVAAVLSYCGQRVVGFVYRIVRA